jgi:peptidoglycan/xylan/chitin deacetylase (PgdA/CDA1 family)
MKRKRFKINRLKNKSLLKPLGFVLVITAVLWFSNYLINEAVETIWHNSKEHLPIYCVETDSKKIAISFDAAWGNEDTQDLLAILDKYNIKATFFLVGGWIDKYPEDVKRINECGHDIGNHSTTHPHMTQLSKEKCVNELMDTHKKIKELIGCEMDLFRPPYGDYNDNLVKIAKECGYYTIQWDVDTTVIKGKGA